MYGGGEVDVWMRACEDVNGQRREKRYLRFVRSQSLFKRLKTAEDKSVSFQDKNEVNRQQVEAHTKWICARVILVPKTSGE